MPDPVLTGQVPVGPVDIDAVFLQDVHTFVPQILEYAIHVSNV